MIYTHIEEIEKPLSRLVYGTPFSAFSGQKEQTFKDYDVAYDMGFRVFDTAHLYGQGEQMLGDWLTARGVRQDVVILDKGCNPSSFEDPDDFSAQTIREQIEQSLTALQTDHVELYILHRDDPSKPVDEIVEVLNELKQQGKIIRFGGSNWSMDRIIEANAYAKAHGLDGFSVCSPNYTYANIIRDPWGGSITLTGDANKPFRDFLKENQMPVFNYSTLARGFLSGKYKSDSTEPIENVLGEGTILEYYAPENIKRLAKLEALAKELQSTVPQIAMAWILKQPMNLFPITTPTGESHVKEVVDALDIHLTQEQLAWLDHID